MRASDGILTLPGPLRGGRITPPVAAVVGAAIVVIVAVVVAMTGVLGAGRSGEPVPAVPRGGGVATTGSPPAAGQRTGAPPGAESGPSAVRSSAGVPRGGSSLGGSQPGMAAPSTVVVHVVGAVRREGVVQLPAGSRVQDALKAAGGTTRKAVLRGLNLARTVVDGEQIFVPDSVNAPVPIPTTPPGGAGSTAPSGPVDLNAADKAALMTLPGVGEKTAEKIIAWRDLHGRFTSVDELGEVQGIGEKRLERLRPLVKV